MGEVRRYNNENIVLDERATRSFLMDLFHPSVTENVDLPQCTRIENEDGSVTYCFDVQ